MDVDEKKYNCPLCDTQVNFLSGMKKATCPKCGNVVAPEDLLSGNGRNLTVRPWLIVLLALIAVVAVIWGYIVAGDSSSSTSTGTLYISFGAVDSIATDNYANENLQYFYYIPEDIADGNHSSYPVLVMVPGLSGSGQSFVSQEFKEFADDEGFIIVAPSFQFDEQNWDSQQSYQYPWVWSGDALIDIVEQVELGNGITFSDWYLFGFSAGAQFSLRFCVWQPDLCAACAAHGSGGTVIPEEYVDVAFFITVGNQDTSRIPKAQAFYNAARGLGIEVTYREYGVGHQLSSAQIDDSLEFFGAVK